MKRLLLLIAFAISVFHMHPIFSESHCENAEKIYISPERLKIVREGIFVNFRDDWIKIGALFSDENGVYIQDLTPEEMGCRDGFWPCRNCDKCVKWYYDICPHCNKPT